MYEYLFYFYSMREEFLHYVWQYKKFRFSEAVTASGLPVIIVDSGALNEHSGPDFFNSRLKIGEQLWAGNVEIHINASDWYVHGHETDPNYDNVILHVVWNHDADVFRRDNSVIPVLEIKSLVEEHTFLRYSDLMNEPSGKWINCESDFGSFDSFHMDHWLERLYFERLESKSELIFKMLKASSNNWEEVLFKMITRNFGLNVNGEAFNSLAHSIPFSVVRKIKDKERLEALFMGQAGMLDEEIQESYYEKLKAAYDFMKHKYQLKREGVTAVKFFRLRPDNFPTIRLAQLASLYAKKSGLFSEVVNAAQITDFYRLFEVEVSGFWENHFTFQKEHKPKKKPLTRNFIDLIIINTLIPIKFCYAKMQGEDRNDEIFEMISGVKKEENQTIRKFDLLRPKSAVNALQSQALLQLKKNYCDLNKCLQCSLGVKLLHREEQI